MKYLAFDLDGIICEEDESYDFINKTMVENIEWYINKKPIYDTIDYMKELSDSGKYRITIFTARNLFYLETTKEWLEQYNVTYDNLIMNKPYYDIFLENRSCTHINDLEELLK